MTPIKNPCKKRNLNRGMTRKGLIVKGKLGWDCPRDKACWVRWSYSTWKDITGLGELTSTWLIFVLVKFCTTFQIFQVIYFYWSIFVLIKFCTTFQIFQVIKFCTLERLINFCTDQLLYWLIFVLVKFWSACRVCWCVTVVCHSVLQH